MSTLFLYTDLSPSWPWLFSTIHKNRSLLSEYRIECAMFYPYTTESIPSHNIYYKNSVINDKKHIPQFMDTWRYSLLSQLKSGSNILIMSGFSDIAAQISFTRLLQNNIDFTSHNIRLLFRIGKPACVLEQNFRMQRSSPSMSQALQIIHSHLSYELLIKAMQREWGEECVTVLPDSTDGTESKKGSLEPNQLFDWLGCPSPKLPEHTPVHPLFLASWEGRRLSMTFEVGLNAWPFMDNGIFMDSLCKIEQEWSKDPICPLKYRKIFLQKSADSVCALEERLGLPSNSLACPEWLATQPEVPIGLPLPQDKVCAFTSALSKREQEVLRQRYNNDVILLSPDQRAIRKALLKDDGTATHIGDAVPPPTLCVLTMTYNHEKYIAECMESVLAQKTDFSVRHIVLDHYSQDDTPLIVASYAEKYPSIQPVLLSCHAASENVHGLFIRCRSTYAALCDGDDYFTDPLKLQKQVDYLEKNTDCALCAHPVHVVFENQELQNYVYPPQSQLPLGFDAKYPIEQLFQGNFIQTNSVVYRWRFTDGLPEWFNSNLCPGDWYWHFLHAEIGKIGFISDIMSVYRRHSTAIYHLANKSPIENRRKYGILELYMYKSLNDHFNGKYFKEIASLANGVFTNFLQISIDKNNDTLLTHALETFPDFGTYFLNSVNVICGSKHNNS